MRVMASAYDLDGWHDFAIATAGAGAALAGLLFVAISINVREILDDATLPTRAAGALVTLTTPLVLSLLLLIPTGSDDAVAVCLLAGALTSTAALWHANRPSRRGSHRTMRAWWFASGMPALVMSVAMLLAAIGLLTTSFGGLYWLTLAVIVAVVWGLLQAWVLLIEILR
jgi:modulator of FtsH protease